MCIPYIMVLWRDLFLTSGMAPISNSLELRLCLCFFPQGAEKLWRHLKD